ncbi:MAG: hypothetical protein V4507_13650, partial [Verrucomicrobiota bacterium]
NQSQEDEGQYNVTTKHGTSIRTTFSLKNPYLILKHQNCRIFTRRQRRERRKIQKNVSFWKMHFGFKQKQWI